MAEPADLIPVKFSEDTAQFADLRPVRRQPMTLHELVGLLLTSTGKHPERLRERLAKGTCTYNIYRYWWEGFEIDPPTLDAVLAEFPDPDPARLFHPADCVWARLFDEQQPVPHEALIEKVEASRRRWLRPKTFWAHMIEFAASRQPVYQDYFYYHRADLYRVALTPGDVLALRADSQRLATRGLRQRLAGAWAWVGLELACER
jgi:hypothetical protein